MRRLLIALAALIVLGAGGLLWWMSRGTPYIRDRVLDALNQRFASEVGLQSLQISVVPRPRLAGTGLSLRHNGRRDVPPLISIESFDASASVAGLIWKPLHLRHVRLDGLDIRLPPGALRSSTRGSDEPHEAHEAAESPILIDEIVARAARLELASARPGRLPRIFDIHDLVMHGFGMQEGARFQAGMTNPVPRGRIETSGTFGPWHTDEPRLTPVRGQYTFKQADLDDIKGIGGILSSVGTYQGVLERIEVEGQTETPDFSIDIAGQPVPLTTRFQAIVDGTNGDTHLERVEARLVESTIIAAGSVVRAVDVKGRRVSLEIQLERARIEDLMRLAVKAARPPLVGRVNMTTSFLLPAGSDDVVDRLQLDGRFRLAEARFTNIDVQKQITTLSRRGRGEEDDAGAGRESVVSNLAGQFRLRNARLSFSSLTFAVPGATVQLVGFYDLRSEALDFAGDLLVDATLADMTSGFKSLLARLAQPLFRREGGGSKLPIRISGTRSQPSFRVDMRRVFRRS